MRGALDIDGVCIRSGVISDKTLALIGFEFASSSGRPGTRGFNMSDSIAALIGASGLLGSLAADAMGGSARPVRILLFDKTPESNWAVPWHQDRSIVVNKRANVDGFGPWTVKDGVDHVEPPVSILEGMLTLRLFVDDCGTDDGPLLVALGSHRRGRLAGKDVAQLVGESELFFGTGQAGDVLIMKTLAVHSSKRAVAPTHRRILHVDYAMTDLPPPLEWKLN